MRRSRERRRDNSDTISEWSYGPETKFQPGDYTYTVHESVVHHFTSPYTLSEFLAMVAERGSSLYEVREIPEGQDPLEDEGL